MTTKTKFGMIFAIPVFTIFLIGSFFLMVSIWIIAQINNITGTGSALNHLLNESKRYQKRMKFRNALSKIDQQTIKK